MKPKLHSLFDNTLRIKKFAESNPLPDIRNGEETYVFHVGQKVFSAGTGAVIEGVELIIEKRICANGYCRYFASGQWHRQNDLRVDNI